MPTWKLIFYCIVELVIPVLVSLCQLKVEDKAPGLKINGKIIQ